jgi:hypothetical protein
MNDLERVLSNPARLLRSEDEPARPRGDRPAPAPPVPRAAGATDADAVGFQPGDRLG